MGGICVRQMLRIMLAMLLLAAVSRLMTKAPSKTTASKKAYNLQQRFEAAYADITAVTAPVAPIASAGNAAFLAGLNPIGGVSFLTTFGGSPTLAELTVDVQAAYTAFNTLLSSMASSNFT